MAPQTRFGRGLWGRRWLIVVGLVRVLVKDGAAVTPSLSAC